MSNKELYHGRRDTFYYIELFDKSTSRDNKISELFGIEPTKRYRSFNDSTSKIYLAKFWKDESSAIRACRYKTGVTSFVKKMTQEEFIESIPDLNQIEDASEKTHPNYIKNLKHKKDEIVYLENWILEREKYKAISSYKKVSKPQWWYPCKNCGLIPLVWEFDNGRSTACGCGENEYNHHSIRAESIMSYVKRHDGSASGYNSDELRMNWNQWVIAGQDIYNDMKKKNSEIW